MRSTRTWFSLHHPTATCSSPHSTCSAYHPSSLWSSPSRHPPAPCQVCNQRHLLPNRQRRTPWCSRISAPRLPPARRMRSTRTWFSLHHPTATCNSPRSTCSAYHPSSLQSSPSCHPPAARHHPLEGVSLISLVASALCTSM